MDVKRSNGVTGGVERILRVIALCLLLVGVTCITLNSYRKSYQSRLLKKKEKERLRERALLNAYYSLSFLKGDIDSLSYKLRLDELFDLMTIQS